MRTRCILSRRQAVSCALRNRLSAHRVTGTVFTEMDGSREGVRLYQGGMESARVKEKKENSKL